MTTPWNRTEPAVLRVFQNWVVVVLRSPIHANEPSEYNGTLYRTSNRVLNNGIKVIILICMDGTSQYHHHQYCHHFPCLWRIMASFALLFCALKPLMQTCTLIPCIYFTVRILFNDRCTSSVMYATQGYQSMAHDRLQILVNNNLGYKDDWLQISDPH